MRGAGVRFAWPARVALAVLAAWLAAATQAASPASAPAAVDKPVPPAEVRRWFARIHVAAQVLNYQGTLVSSADGVLSSARVAHFHDGHVSFERVSRCSTAGCSRSSATTTRC